MFQTHWNFLISHQVFIRSYHLPYPAWATMHNLKSNRIDLSISCFAENWNLNSICACVCVCVRAEIGNTILFSEQTGFKSKRICGNKKWSVKTHQMLCNSRHPERSWMLNRCRWHIWWLTNWFLFRLHWIKSRLDRGVHSMLARQIHPPTQCHSNETKYFECDAFVLLEFPTKFEYFEPRN